MGRLDEAMRRAAEAAGEGRTTNVGATIGVEVADVANEPFPNEDPDRMRAAGAASRADGPAASAEIRERHGNPTLMEQLDHKLARKIVIDQNMMPASREQYRKLAAGLHHAQAANGLRIVMIASAVASEGKTLTASNLALTLSESYHRTVLLIDADLRRPSLHTVFQIPGSPGLSEGLMSTQDQKLPVHQVSARLTVLPAGRASSDPMAGLTSKRMRRLLDEAKAGFQWVIIDTPPIGLLTDASLLATMVDGVILVVKAGATPYELVKRAVASIGPEKLVGVVLNRATPRPGKYGYDYKSYYHAPNPEAGQAR